MARWRSRPREAPARRPARLLRGRRPRGADRRARARALRRRRSTCARRSSTTSTWSSSSASAARSSSRSSTTTIPEGAITVFSAHGVSPAVHADAERRNLQHDRRDLPAGDQGPRRGEEVRRRGLHDRPHRPRRPRGGRGHDGRGARAHRAGRDRGRRRRARGRRPRAHRLHLPDHAVGRRDARDHQPPARALPGHHRAPHRRHLLRHDQPPGRRQADGRRTATWCW